MMQATNLKTNHLTQPLGIDAGTLFLSWQCAAAGVPDRLRIEGLPEPKTLWTSGKVLSGVMHTGSPRRCGRPRRRGRRIRLWDENDQPGAWSNASFETGWQWC